MAPLVLLLRSFNPSNGGFEVKVVQRRRQSSRKNKLAGSIEVVYNQYINSVYPSFHYASLPLNGAHISGDEVEQVLKDAKVPDFIHGGAIDMILRCVNDKNINGGGSGSILARIVFDNEATGLSDFESDDDEEEDEDEELQY